GPRLRLRSGLSRRPAAGNGGVDGFDAPWRLFRRVGGGAAGGGIYRGASFGYSSRVTAARQEGDHGSVQGRWRRQHLRERSALARRNRSVTNGKGRNAGGSCRPAQRDSVRAARGDRRGRVQHPRLPKREWRGRRVRAIPVGVRPRRRTLPPLWRETY